MATASTTRSETDNSISRSTFDWKPYLPYAVAVLAQLPILFLYFRGLWARPHYQFFPFAIAACIYLAYLRWPKNQPQVIRRSFASDLLFGIGFLLAVTGLLFLEPWFNAASVILIVTSLLTRIYDQSIDRTLWPVALPLFICLSAPFNLDSAIITGLQSISAVFSSQLLDLIGTGHFMDGINIILPNGKEFQIEEGCSGVVSFFTLLAIATVFIVWAKRIFHYPTNVVALLVGLGLLLAVLEFLIIGSFGYISLIGLGLLLTGLLGFHAAILLMSTIFWAIFMNTLRIVMIPIADVKMDGLNLAEGVPHHLLGYAVLIAGALLVFSTDQFLAFLFGPVEEDQEEGKGLNRSTTRFWNTFFSGTGKSQSSRRVAKEIDYSEPKSSRSFIWGAAGIILLMGLLQLWDVQRSWAQSNYRVRFFDSDVTVDFRKDDLPTMLESWEQVDYQMQDRTRGSDLGQRSDFWVYQGPRCAANLSLDQTFPGWHELTTCYKNQGWKVLARVVHEENQEGESGWPYVEARLKRNTGEHGYLLFSLFDAQGKPIEAPSWNKLSAFLVRAQNRLSNRIRSTLFDGEAYQTQIFLASYNEFDEDLKNEARERFLAARQLMRDRFMEIRKED